MTIRDLGYKPYEGARLPPSNNSWVMLRQGLARAWASWLVKIAVFLSIFPPLIACLAVGALRYLASQMGQSEETVELGSRALRELFRYETWLVVSLVTFGAGAAAIAEDLTFKALQFYFSKPVTPLQYLVGRVSAIAILLFAMTFLGGLFVVLIAGVTAQPEHRVDDFGLLAPMLVYSLVLSLFMASASVSVSCLSPSRALTMSAWGLLFVVPHVIASIVDGIANGDFPWLFLASFTGLLGTVADALFKVETESDLEWFHAAPILLGLAVLGLWGAHERLRHAEVVK
jgi:hypothetical protein